MMIFVNPVDSAMSDPRLNSVHLPAARREEFRAARAGLVRSTGSETVMGVKPPPKSDSGQHTIMERQDEIFPPGIDHVLVDDDCVYPLNTGINTVGRMPDNDVIVADPYVSRRHIAVVVHVKGSCELHDVASKNGTYLNGHNIHGPTKLRSGDQIHLSDHLLVFLCRRDDDSDPGTDITPIQ